MAAFDDCTNQINDLIYKWLVVLRGESAELPVCIRFDMLCKYTGPGKSHVMIGELTELGGCFLGWAEGPQTVFSAVIDSYFGRLSQSVSGAQTVLNKEDQNNGQLMVTDDAVPQWLKAMGVSRLPPRCPSTASAVNDVMPPPNQPPPGQEGQNQQNQPPAPLGAAQPQPQQQQ